MLAVSACSPAQVQQWFAARGVTVDHPTSEAISRQLAYQRLASSYNPAWDRVAACESGGNWHISTGNGYYGGLQFNLATWRSNGGSGYPHQASKMEQIRVATNLYNARGSQPWPHCGRYLP